MPNDDKKQMLVNHDQIQISTETNQALNQPLKDDEDIDPVDLEFLKMLIDKVDKGEIQLLQPSSLLNLPVYDNLDEPAKGKADYDAVNLLNSVREIHRLWQSGHRDSFQIINLVHKMRLTKERLENLGGDIYII
jgi:hypothetical protein